eukprot:COSAG03_NODE_2317_length_2889_cov_26.777419_7_plen_136_part_00
MVVERMGNWLRQSPIFPTTRGTGAGAVAASASGVGSLVATQLSPAVNHSSGRVHESSIGTNGAPTCCGETLLSTGLKPDITRPIGLQLDAGTVGEARCTGHACQQSREYVHTESQEPLFREKQTIRPKRLREPGH